MTRQAIIVFGVLLGAGLAGLLWYQLTRSPEEKVALLSPTPVISEAPAATVIPTPTPLPTQAPMAVSNTAPTGARELFLVLTMGATLAGGYGLRRTLQGGNF